MKKGMPLILVIATACAHGAAAPPEATQAWPAPPERAQVRYLGAYPDGEEWRPRPGVWSRILSVILGTEDETRRDGPLLTRPFGLAVRGDELFVADPDGQAVLRIRPGTRDLSPVRCGNHPWVMPMAVAAGPDGALWIADGGAGALVKVEPSGVCTEVGRQSLERPSGVAVVGEAIWVADPPRHAVVAFSFDGREVGRLGGRGSGDGQLNFPTAVAPDGEGGLLVVDALNFRISRFGAGGHYRGAFGEAGDGGGAFGRPKAVAVDPAGRIYVTDAQHDVVVVFDAGGAFELSVGGTGSAPGSLAMPAGVAITERRLFVADSRNHRIQIYELLGGEP